MVGALVISLDFELLWGVRDHRTAQDYGDAILGGRRTIPQMLARFETAHMRATWATVGLLFARNRDEMIDYAPSIRPTYRDPSLSPYAAIETAVGRNEDEDKLHFGRSLIERIAGTAGQEIATHTYSHYYCLEDGQQPEQFDADLAAAVRIAERDGIRHRSIVFPRNQMSNEHVALCCKRGITAWRGNQEGFLYRSRASSSQSPLIRGGRLIESALPFAGSFSFTQPHVRIGAVDVPASRFLRPWSRSLPGLSLMQIRRIEAEMRRAAMRGEIYHLWWHPHNFGRNIELNLARLDRIIGHFKRLSDDYGMESLAMVDIASRAELLANSEQIAVIRDVA
jgi:peptidoglycan/xylan/chitin deacetylase (PgdA/CDA1 family)